jgi:hypothetical protein|tara:strand:+ start:1430 stop:1819 length:390 start_codon:yes stop_codon:yes gene_type:complete
MPVSKKDRCPTCGSVYKGKNLDKQIKSMRLSHSVEYGKLLDHILWKINSVRTKALVDREIYGFLTSVNDCDDEMAVISMNNYIEKKYAISGKGLPYLASMIFNSSVNKKSRQDYEFKSLDRLPPRIDEA